MCNACGFMCCAYDGFSRCGCDHCDNPDCWSDDNDFTCESDDDDWGDYETDVGRQEAHPEFSSPTPPTEGSET